MKENKKDTKHYGCTKSIGGIMGLLVAIPVLLVLGIMGLRALGAYLILSSNAQASNAIIVLSGGDETRMRTALQLYNDKYASMIILTETGDVAEGYGYLHSFDMRIQLLANGVPAGNILLTDGVVSNTKDEARLVKNLMLSQQMKSGIIVTDPYHMRRAFDIFQKEFKDTDIHLYIQAAYGSWYNPRTWFFHIDGWRFTVLEYVKMLAEKLNLKID